MRRFIYFFQLGCTSEHFSFFFLFSPVASGRCQETVTSHGINSFSPILPDFLLEETRLFAEPRNTLEHPVLIVRRPPTPTIHPSSPIFHKICIRGCAADSCFEFRDILACVCQRNPLSLSLSLEDTGTILEALCLQISLLTLSYLSPLSSRMKLISTRSFYMDLREFVYHRDMERGG